MKILTTILTCSGTQKRANACLDTWVQDLKPPHDYVFYGDKAQSQSMDKTWNCTPDAGECRGRLPEKTYKMLNKSLDYEWDFLFKCDDDTFVNFDKLIEFLNTYDHSQDLYIGHRLWRADWGYAQGGAGYILTRSSVQKCIQSLKIFYKNPRENASAEDFSVGKALNMQNIRITPTQLLHSHNPDWARRNQDDIPEWYANNPFITMHYIQADTMHKIYQQQNKT
jgi:hypothetical protein